MFCNTGCTFYFLSFLLIFHFVFQMDSIFQLRRPYDFLALAQQEQRAMQVETLKKDLMTQKSQIDRNEDKASFICVFIYFLPVALCNNVFLLSTATKAR